MKKGDFARKGSWLLSFGTLHRAAACRFRPADKLHEAAIHGMDRTVWNSIFRHGTSCEDHYARVRICVGFAFYTFFLARNPIFAMMDIWILVHRLHFDSSLRWFIQISGLPASIDASKTKPSSPSRRLSCSISLIIVYLEKLFPLTLVKSIPRTTQSMPGLTILAAVHHRTETPAVLTSTSLLPLQIRNPAKTAAALGTLTSSCLRPKLVCEPQILAGHITVCPFLSYFQFFNDSPSSSVPLTAISLTRRARGNLAKHSTTSHIQEVVRMATDSLQR